jgi:hypothetical protein
VRRSLVRLLRCWSLGSRALGRAGCSPGGETYPPGRQFRWPGTAERRCLLPVRLTCCGRLLGSVVPGAVWVNWCSAPRGGIGGGAGAHSGHHRALAAPVGVILADDLQWVDGLSLALCHYLVQAAETSGAPLALIATGRPSANMRHCRPRWRRSCLRSGWRGSARAAGGGEAWAGEVARAGAGGRAGPGGRLVGWWVPVLGGSAGPHGRSHATRRGW